MKKIIVLFVMLLLLAGCTTGNEPAVEPAPSEKFAAEYPGVDSDNLFVYRSAEEAITIIEHGTGIVYFGFPECQWCQAYVPHLNAIAKEHNLDKIYYVNIAEDRSSNSESYQKIVELLSGRLQYDEEGKERIYVPEIVFVVEGEIIGNDHETSKNTKGYEKAEDYWTNEDMSELIEKLNDLSDQVDKALEACGACTL